MHRFCDTEGAAIGDTTRRLIRKDAIYLNVRRAKLIRAGNDAEEASGELRGVSRCVKGAVIGERLHPKRLHRAVARCGQLSGDVIVACEAIGLQILRAILDPFDGQPGLDGRDRGDDIAGIHGYLAAESTSNIWRNDTDLVLRDATDQRENGAYGVRRLRGHVDRQLAADPVEGSHATAGLDG